ncbi:MAG: hypothetical protein EPN21_15625 [Methylococcaceae bacterium]|nr:MAG: hypothetical protein EPN21_15625 [Methylococcaceae bacterium]
MEIRVVKAGSTSAWFKEGFALFRLAPWIWIAQVVVFFAILIVLSLVPVLGQVAAALLSTVFVGGLQWACEQGRNGQEMKFEYLFEGFRRSTTPLILLGVYYAIGTFLAVALATVLVAATGFGLSDGGDGGDAALGVMALGPLLMALVAMVFSLPLAMAIWFAPSLVIFDEQSPWDAMKLSFIGCCKNWLALTLYGIWFVVLSLLASIPAGLGWLVLIPTIIGSTYAGYREIYRPA